MLTDRFWEKVDLPDLDGCWNWNAGRYHFGHGMFWLNGKNRVASRVMAAHCLGVCEVPRDVLVCHHCDNPPCVNPEHLFLGSYGDNAADRERKNRSNRSSGESHHCAKLTLDNVIAIRRHGKTMKLREHAEVYGVSEAQVSRILSGKTWRSAL